MHTATRRNQNIPANFMVSVRNFGNYCAHPISGAEYTVELWEIHSENHREHDDVAEHQLQKGRPLISLVARPSGVRR